LNLRIPEKCQVEHRRIPRALARGLGVPLDKRRKEPQAGQAPLPQDRIRPMPLGQLELLVDLAVGLADL
jgi:hypothetical protein